jgi:hypothetical protein
VKLLATTAPFMSENFRSHKERKKDKDKWKREGNGVRLKKLRRAR